MAGLVEPFPHPELFMRSRLSAQGEPDGVVRGPQSAGKVPIVELDMEKELSEIRKEVVESRNLVIKTDNLLKNLHAELKSVSKRQDDIAMKGWVGSAVAYAGFFVLAVGGSLMVSNARVASAREDATALTKQADLLKGQLASLQSEVAARKTAADSASRVYAAIADGTTEAARLHAIDALAGLDRQKLTPLESRALDDRARLLKAELANAALDEGKTAFHRHDMKTSTVALKRFLALAPDAPEAVYANFMLGDALYEQKDWRGSIGPLEKFAANPKGQKDVDYGLLMLGQAYENVGSHDKVMSLMDHATRDYPGSRFVPDMQRLYSRAKRAQAEIASPPGSSASGTAAPAPKAAAAPAPAAPAPAAPAASN